MKSKEETPLRGSRVVIGSIGDDIHVVGITILAHALRNAGCEVIQLGIQTPAEEFIATTIAEDADAMFISSSNGHAAMFCETLREDLVKAGASDVVLYAGGNLAVGADALWEDTEDRMTKMGFDRVFPPRTQPQTAITALVGDLVKKGRGNRYE